MGACGWLCVMAVGMRWEKEIVSLLKCNINATGGEHFMFLTVFSVSTPGFCLETKLSLLGKFCTKCVLC